MPLGVMMMQLKLYLTVRPVHVSCAVRGLTLSTAAAYPAARQHRGRSDRNSARALPALQTECERTLLDLVQTFLQNLHTLLPVNLGLPPLVHCTQTHILPQAVRCVRHSRLGAEVVEPVQMRRRDVTVGGDRGGGGVEAAEEQIDGVWTPGTDGLGESASDPG